MSSSCVKCETIASNEAWKEAGGKTKRGKPTGRREVTEKYKARNNFAKDALPEYTTHADLDALPENRRKGRIENCVYGYNHNKCSLNIRLYHWDAKDRRQARKLAFQDQLLSVEDEAYPEEVEDDACAEDDELFPLRS